MARECEICGKRAAIGNTVAHRGKAKYLGGVGTKVTGIARRQFRPNLQRVRVTTPSGTHKTVRVCTQCIRSGAITKRIHSAPFKLPPGETAPETPVQRPAKKKKKKKK
jgi:large subunit ribosomal protein L28